MCQRMKLPPSLARKGEKHSKSFSKSCCNEEQVWILQKGRLQGSSRERWHAVVIGKEYTEEQRSGSLWNSGLKVWLVDNEKLFSAHCSQRSVTLLMGTETAQFSSRIAVDLQGQRGNGDRENADWQIGPSIEWKASVLGALGQEKPMGKCQTERGDAGRTGLIYFHLSRLFSEVASVTVPLIF